MLWESLRPNVWVAWGNACLEALSAHMSGVVWDRHQLHLVAWRRLVSFHVLVAGGRPQWMFFIWRLREGLSFHMSLVAWARHQWMFAIGSLEKALMLTCLGWPGGKNQWMCAVGGLEKALVFTCLWWPGLWMFAVGGLEKAYVLAGLGKATMHVCNTHMVQCTKSWFLLLSHISQVSLHLSACCACPLAAKTRRLAQSG
jgi:hypothetical protein